MASQYGYVMAPYSPVMQGGMPYIGGAGYPVAPQQQPYGALPASYAAIMQSTVQYTGASPQQGNPFQSTYMPMQGAMPMAAQQPGSFFAPNVAAMPSAMPTAMPYAGGAVSMGLQQQPQMPFGAAGPAAMTANPATAGLGEALQNFGHMTINNYYGGMPDMNAAQAMPGQPSPNPAQPQTGGIPGDPYAQQTGNNQAAQAQMMEFCSKIMNLLGSILSMLMQKQGDAGQQPPSSGNKSCSMDNPAPATGRCQSRKNIRHFGKAGFQKNKKRSVSAYS